DFTGRRTSDFRDKLNIKMIKEFLINHRLSNYETDEKDKDGNLQYYTHNAVGIIENGMLVRIWGTNSNITEQKIAELKLRESELRLTAHINTLPNVVFYEAGDNTRFITENVLDLLGYGADYILEDYARFEALIHPDDHPRIRAAQKIWIDSKSNSIFTCEFRIKHKD